MMISESETFVTFVNEAAINQQLAAFERIAYVNDAVLVNENGKYVFKTRLTALPNASKAQVGAYLLWLNWFTFVSMRFYDRPLGRLLHDDAPFIRRVYNLYLECLDSPSVFPEMNPADFAQKVADASQEELEFFIEDDPRMLQDSGKWLTPDETRFEMNYFSFSDESFGSMYLANCQEYLESHTNWTLTEPQFVKFQAYEARLASQATPF